LLEAKAADAKQQQWARQVIARQMQRMALLLDDLLDVSRITRGRLSLKTEAVDMRSVIDAAIEAARPMIDAKKQTLHLSFPKERLTISVDPLRLSQSLSNLLTNAAKYTDEHGSIEMTVELAPDELKISVKDNGIGLDPSAMPGLFEVFSQLASAIDRSEGGLGIGLALVKGLIALHGGRVEAASDGLGMGSKFTIHLPNSIIVPDTAPPEAPSTVVEGAAQKRRCKVLVGRIRRVRVFF
jgi:signal transduction histidine kinase